MEELEELKNKLAGIIPAMPVLVRKSFEQLKPQIEDLNIKQLSEGKRADGSFLPNYSFVSVGVYGKRPGPMTMHDTGDFYDGLTLVIDDDGIEMKGMDMKTEMLTVHYGDEIIGISEEDIAAIPEEYLEPVLKDEVDQYLDISNE